MPASNVTQTRKRTATVFQEPVSRFLQAPIIVYADDTVKDAAKLMREKQVGSLIVAERDRTSTAKKQPVGILTEWDLLTRVAAEGKDVARTRVREIMSSPLIKIEADSTVGDAIRLMLKRGIRRIAVFEAGTLAGVLTQSQLVGNRRGRSSPLPIVEPLKGHICPYCSLTFGTRGRLSAHVRATHAETLWMEAEENEEFS